MLERTIHANNFSLPIQGLEPDLGVAAEISGSVLGGRRGRAAIMAGAREKLVRQSSGEGTCTDEVADTPRLVKPHPIVVEAKKLYRKARPGDDGRCHPPSDRVLKLRVAPASLERALCLADVLFRAAERRGHAVTLSSGSAGGACISADGESFELSIRERAEQVPHVPTKREQQWSFFAPKCDLRPTGELIVVLEDVDSTVYRERARWSEAGKRWKLEDRIDLVLDGIERIARKRCEERLESERRRRQWEAERERDAEEARRREEQRRRAARLQQQVSAWRLARDIRAFVADMQSAAAEPDASTEPGGELEAWLAWALDHADQMDPTTVLRRSLADRIGDGGPPQGTDSGPTTCV